MLKHHFGDIGGIDQDQPPSGGCVLKHAESYWDKPQNEPAAFGRLCVETNSWIWEDGSIFPAAFGRLCVETLLMLLLLQSLVTSRLRAAVC